MTTYSPSPTTALPKRHRRARWALAAVLLASPLLLTWLWGAPFADPVYAALQAARQVGAGDLSVLGQGRALAQPLTVLLLALGGEGGHALAGVLSALGWSATAVAVWWTLAGAARRHAGAAAALLIVTSPLVVSTAGASTSWVLALGWCALALNRYAGRRPRVSALQLILLLLLLGLHCDAAGFVFALALLLANGLHGRSTWAPPLVLAAAVFSGLALALAFGDPPPPSFALPSWWADLPALARDRQLWWLFAPFALAGLISLRRPAAEAAPGSADAALLREDIGLAGLWGAAALLTGSDLAAATAGLTILVLAGLGLTAVLRAAHARGLLAEGAGTAVFLALLLPLLAAGLLLARDHATNGRAWLALAEEEAAAWLRASSMDTAVLLAPRRVGYLADRPSLPFDLAHLRPEEAGALYARLDAAPPDFVVSQRGLGWDVLTRGGWFKERYTPVQSFGEAGNGAPLTVWQYQPSLFDQGEPAAISAQVAGQFTVVGYAVQPPLFEPGDDIYLTLYLRAEQPLQQGFITGVHLKAPDNRIWAWREEQTPRSLAGAWWQPGQVIAERYRIPTTTDLPPGAYGVEAFWRAADDDDRQLPVLQGGDENVLDRVQLGYVIAPQETAVPGANPVGASFGEQIRLNAAAVDLARPGAPLAVTLVWEALVPVATDYTVFVHLLNEAGDLVAGADGKPAANRLPTPAWRPGLPVVDAHVLELPPDLPAGSYQLKAGLYELESGERLAVRDGSGREVAERALPLGEVLIAGE